MTQLATSWTTDNVAARLEEAVATGRQLPPVRVQGYANLWPPIVRHEWERYAEDKKMVRILPTPAAIERMLEAMTWVQCLTIDRRHLVWMRADNVDWPAISKRFACNRTTAWRHWTGAMQTIADNLNQTEPLRPKKLGQRG